VIATVRLTFGPWRALKRIFKEAEAKGDTEVYGALAARFDKEYAGHGARGVSQRTLAYLARRAWRFLRRTAVQLPATFADVAVDFLSRYPTTRTGETRGSRTTYSFTTRRSTGVPGSTSVGVTTPRRAT
jgi:hypothetical protein